MSPTEVSDFARCFTGEIAKTLGEPRFGISVAATYTTFAGAMANDSAAKNFFKFWNYMLQSSKVTKSEYDTFTMPTELKVRGIRGRRQHRWNAQKA